MARETDGVVVVHGTDRLAVSGDRVVELVGTPQAPIVFTGAIDDRVADARREVAGLTSGAGLSSSQESRLQSTAFADPDDPFAARPEPRTPVEEQARSVVNEEIRDAYGAAYRVGALVTLLAFPFALTMTRKPGEVQSAPVLAAAAG